MSRENYEEALANIRRVTGTADAAEPVAQRGEGWTGSAVAEVSRLAILIGRYPDAARKILASLDEQRGADDEEAAR